MKRASKQLPKLIAACRNGERSSQKQLYQQFYAYAMTICLHYAKHQQEAQEICNDGFYKVFTKLDLYQNHIPFKTWLRRILVNTAIDYHRKYHLRQIQITGDEINEQSSTTSNEGLEELSHNDVMKMVQELPPAYRLAFNLYVIEGYSHREIAEKLSISVGTSKSNLSKAKAKLREKFRNSA